LVAVTLGWLTTEHGRQPWIVYGLVRTADGVSPLAFGSVATSLALFVVVYFLVFGIGIYYILRLMRTVPSAVGATPSGPGGEQRPEAGAGTRGGHRPAAAGDDRQWSHGGRSGGPAPAPAE
jgi:cytochrome d ubiquinol oxidase subunit I